MPIDPAERLQRLEKAGTRTDLPVPGGFLRWRRWCEGATPDTRSPMVLLHGGTGSWMHWVKQIPVLAPHFDLLVPDLPGMGDSAAPETTAPADALVRAMARVLRPGLEELAGRRAVHLVGFSFGAMVGARLAAALGSGVRTFTMIGASGLGLDFPGPGPLAKPDPALSEEALREVHRTNLAAVMLSHPARLDPLALEIQLRNAARVRVQTHPSAKTRVMLEPLARVTAARHAVWGSADRFLPADEAALERLLGRLGIRRHRVDGAGHWAAYEAPDAINRLVLAIASGET